MRRYGALPAVFAALLSIGCGGPAPTPPTRSKPSDPPVNSVKTTNPEITVNSNDGSSFYKVLAQDSEIAVNAKGPDYGSLKGVHGEINQKGQIVSRFSSDIGVIDRDKQSLVLTGNVKVTKEPDSKGDAKREGKEMVLNAQSVKYDQGRGRIEAEGSVTVTSDNLVLGPLPKLYATPDLKKFGTPGKFK